MTDDVAQVLAYMDEHPKTSAKAAAEALGLPGSVARQARKARNAAKRSPARARETDTGEVLELAPRPPPQATHVTMEPVLFWSGEMRLMDRLREMASGSESWVAVAQLTRALHGARDRYDQALAAAPPSPDARSDADLREDLAKELAELPADLRRELLEA